MRIGEACVHAYFFSEMIYSVDVCKGFLESYLPKCIKNIVNLNKNELECL